MIFFFFFVFFFMKSIKFFQAHIYLFFLKSSLIPLLKRQLNPLWNSESLREGLEKK